MLNVRREVFQTALKTPAHIVIQRVIAAQRNSVVSVEQAPNLKNRRAHRDSEQFRLRAARHGDAVIVSEDDERAIMERGVKSPLSRRVKVVGVNYGDSGHNKTSTDSGEMLFDSSEMMSDGMHDSAEYLRFFVQFYFGVSAVGRAEE